MLLNLSKRGWTAGLRLADFAQHSAANEKVVKELKGLAERCARWAGAPACCPWWERKSSPYVWGFRLSEGILTALHAAP